ncbi:MAG TPA: lactate utilization protein [bacterium]|nr:lactate utilization protein [bacterium]
MKSSADYSLEIYELQAKQLIKNLKKRNIKSVYCKDRHAAITQICKLIPRKAVVGLGGSMTVVESGLVDALRNLDIDLLDRYRKGVTDGEISEMRKAGMSADVFIASCNAITHDGKLVNEDGLGNRVAGMIFGPEKIILMAGMNKVVPSVEDGIKRIKNFVAPRNCLRFGVDTPCARTGFCDETNCLPPSRICNQLTIIEANAVPDRITVILVGEELGF